MITLNASSVALLLASSALLARGCCGFEDDDEDEDEAEDEDDIVGEMVNDINQKVVSILLK